MIKNIYNTLVIISMVVLTLACKKTLDVDPSDVVPADENYQNSQDSRSMVMGICGLHKEMLNDQFVLLGELRADLMDATTNADVYMRQISTHSVDSLNPYVKPENFYRVILSCNDAMKNLQTMKSTGKLSSTQFASDYSDIAAFRCWVYYLLAVQFGNVPYVSEPIESLSELQNGVYPVLSLSVMIDTLIGTMQNLPSMAQSTWANADGYLTARTFVQKSLFLADLQLWKGNYREAAVRYKIFLDYGSYNTLYSSDNTTDDDDILKSKCNTSYFNTTAWKDMFSSKATNTAYNCELLWMGYEDVDYDETNNLVKYFSKSYGQYLIKPSQLSIQNWKNQVLSNGLPGDVFRGEGMSWAWDNGQPVVQKYLHYVTSAFNNDADMYIYRAGTLALRYAEAVNRLGYYKLALAMIYSTGSLNADPATSNTDDLFDFHRQDKYSTRNNNGNNFYASTSGVRNRVGLAAVTLPSIGPLLTDTIKAVEKIILDEYGLELAYEGERWSDYLRIATRWNKDLRGTGTDLLSNGIAKKFEVAGDMATANKVRTKLQDPNNWFLPLYRFKSK
jgi:starch-binding outer membrane protein, SusD/RagB family